MCVIGCGFACRVLFVCVYAFVTDGSLHSLRVDNVFLCVIQCVCFCVCRGLFV